MDEQDFATIVATLDEPAAVAEPEAGTAPILDSVPVDDAPVVDEPVDPSPATAEPALIAGDTATPIPAISPPNWADPSNPYFVQAQQLEQERQRLAWEQEQARAAQQQQQAYQQQLAQQQEWQVQDARLRDIAAGDLEAYEELRTIMDKRIQPLVQQAQQWANDSEQAKKTATAMHIAATSFFTDETRRQAFTAEVQRLMNLANPDQMLADVQYRQSLRQQQETELQRIQRENAELKKHLAAQQAVRDRQARGADAVAVSSTGTVVHGAADYADFDALFNDLIGAG